MAAPLHSVDQHPDEKIAETLESLAKRARAGELVGFVALLNFRERTGSARAGYWQRRDALMAFELWKLRMLSGLEEED